MSTHNVIFDKIREGKQISEYTDEEVKIIKSKPLAKAMYVTALEDKKEEELIIRDKKKEKVPTESEVKMTPWNRTQKVECEICHKIFSRANRSSHIKSELHQAYLGINKKFRKLILEN